MQDQLHALQKEGFEIPEFRTQCGADDPTLVGQKRFLSVNLFRVVEDDTKAKDAILYGKLMIY